MQPTGIGVASVVELSARVQLRKDDLDAGDAQLRMSIHRDAASVVLNDGAAVRKECHADGVGIEIGGFVDGVVDNFPQQLMQSPLPRCTDIHARAGGEPPPDLLKLQYHWRRMYRPLILRSSRRGHAPQARPAAQF